MRAGAFPQGQFICPEDVKYFGVPADAGIGGADDPASPVFLVTRRGLGYLFNA